MKHLTNEDFDALGRAILLMASTAKCHDINDEARVPADRALLVLHKYGYDDSWIEMIEDDVKV